MKGGRSGVAKDRPTGHILRGLPYLITVGVPVTVQPGMLTELLPDRDGSPISAPGLTRRFGLVARLCDVVAEARAPHATDRRASRRATCSTARAAVGWVWSFTGPLPDTGADTAAAICWRVAAAGVCIRFFDVAAAALRVARCGACADVPCGTDEVAEPESDGWAAARPGDEATAIPIPSATAKPPMRPIWQADPMTSPFACAVMRAPMSVAAPVPAPSLPVVPVAAGPTAEWFPRRSGSRRPGPRPG